jgi:hypothetical protein
MSSSKMMLVSADAMACPGQGRPTRLNQLSGHRRRLASGRSTQERAAGERRQLFRRRAADNVAVVSGTGGDTARCFLDGDGVVE